jgi:plastocyanin
VVGYSFAAGQNVTGTVPAPTGNITGGGNLTAPGGNVTGDNETTTAAGEIDAFLARGLVVSTISDSLLGGRWKIDVIDGEVQRVQINMTMAKSDGSDFHTLLIDNFTAGGAGNETGTAGGNVTGGNMTTGNVTGGGNETGGNTTAGNDTTLTFPQLVTGGNMTSGNVTALGNETTTAGAVSLSQDGTFEISGRANIYMNNEVQWENVPITIESTGRVLIIDVDHEVTDNHFEGQQIFGFVTALIGDVDGTKQSVLPPLETEGVVTRPAPTEPTLPNATAPGNETAPGGNVTTPGNETTGNQTPSAPAAGGGGVTDVSIVPGSATLSEGGYDPDPVEISVGDTVRWTNDDSTPHTITSGGPDDPDAGQEFDSSPNLNPLLAPGDTFEHTFTEAGEFPYYCQLHPNLVGTIIVS